MQIDTARPKGAVMECDLLVLGAGAGGLTTAVTARKHGLDVLVVEKEPTFGGTAAYSGGVLWIPSSAHAPPGDSAEAARTYLRQEAGIFYDEAAVDAFLEAGPRMVEFLERETEVKFVPTLYPDYHPDRPGGVKVGRSILAAPYDIRKLGVDMARLRPPLETLTFVGMMFNSSNADLRHFFRATKSLRSAIYVARRLANHFKDLAIHRRGVQVTSGNALAARLAKSALDLKVPIWTSSTATRLLTDGGGVRGAVVQREGAEFEVRARKGVVLACGGFSRNEHRIRQAYPHLRSGGEHLSPVPVGNSGDGATLAESVGARLELRFPNAAAWMPVSRVPLGKGRHGVFPHLLDRYKPGVIGVLRNGRRFTNESNSYHDVGEALIAACANERETAMWLVCDATAIAKYGLGYAKPAPLPLAPLVRDGYLHKGATLQQLARAAGIDQEGLERTVREFNAGASHGEDREFERGQTVFNRYLADPEQHPNPCVAPIAKEPFYALKVVMGDLGTFDGLRTTINGNVLDPDNRAIPGLFAVGNDRASIMGGSYPAAGITLGPIMTFAWLTARHIAGIPDQ